MPDFLIWGLVGIALVVLLAGGTLVVGKLRFGTVPEPPRIWRIAGVAAEHLAPGDKVVLNWDGRVYRVRKPVGLTG